MRALRPFLFEDGLILKMLNCERLGSVLRLSLNKIGLKILKNESGEMSVIDFIHALHDQRSEKFIKSRSCSRFKSQISNLSID